MKTCELVVMLNGNFCVVQIDDSTKDKVWGTIFEVYIKGQTDPNAYLKLGDYTILAKHIVGWYFRPVMKSQAEQVVTLLKKEFPPPDEPGESWKHSED